ncbi:ABC transporter permease [Paraclostridium ghonii]|uniref:ABC transport system permease protein n=1 Tax=Paraclostridium ghonii TaxID=29358 RepID=A0ABU0MXG1_9FIRM|nr:ABC transporter permease [Paeniclostridium ghonii]MDQ0555603.1 putative ABC transport system permease protein [Paeniclostridium ghonii]
MGIYFKISLSYLRKNKLRTSLLTLGVVLGVTLIFGLNVIKESQNKNDVNAIHKLYGGYHLEFNNLNFTNTEKLKNDKGILKITTVQNLGNIVDKQGNSFSLKSAGKDYLTGKSSKLIKGRTPMNSNEIVIEKKALEAMNMDDTLNSTLDFTIKKKYTDSEGNNQIYTTDKRFKLVGVIEKPKGFYDDIFDLEAFTYRNDEKNNIIPQNIVTYNSILSLKSGWQNIQGQAENIIQANNLGKKSYVPNIPLVKELCDIEIEKDNPDVYKKEILIIIAASIFIFNIFNITLNEIVKEMGLLRLIGSSKKKVRLIIVYQALIIMVIGIILGLSFGLGFSYVGVNIYNVQLYQESVMKPRLYVSNLNIIKAIIIGVFAVVASCIIPMWKVGNVSTIETTKKTDKVKKFRGSYRLNNLFSKLFGFYGFMGLKNIGRNKTRAFISMLSIALGGYIFITTFSSMQGEVNNKIEDMQNRYDITMQFGGISDVDTLRYTDNNVNKIKNINGVKSVNTVQESDGFFDFKNNEINKEFIKYNGIETRDKMEYEMQLRLYGSDYIKETLNRFVQDGNLDDIGKVTNGYQNIAVYNYFYDKVNEHTLKKVFTNINIGDILIIKLPITEKGKVVYKENKVRVCATLKPEWMSRGGGSFGHNFEIITSQNHSESLTGEQKYTKLGINLKDPYDKTINKKVQEVSNGIHGSQFNSRLMYREIGKSLSENYMKSQISIIVLVLIIAGINIFCTIRTNLLIRKKEISTLRAIGLSFRNMKKMVIYEALTYAILSFIITLIPSTINLIKFVNWNNDAYINFGIEHFMNFTFPFKESIIFLIISIIVCILAVMTSNREFKNMSIIEGVKASD